MTATGFPLVAAVTALCVPVSVAEEMAVKEEVTVTRTHEVESEHQEGRQELYVWLPDNYDTNKPYRVLYLLPIGPGRMSPGKKRFGNELEEFPKLDACNKYDLIVCRPSFADVPWFGKQEQRDYVKDVVVPFIEQNYSALGTPEGRLLLGYSKSGSGAFSIIMQYPDFFGYAASWDGNMNLGEFKKTLKVAPEQLAPFKEKTRLVLADGEKNYWRKANIAYHVALQEAGILHTYDDTQSVGHAWNVKWMAPTLKALMDLCDEGEPKRR
jgi:enterochelin esterase-like enzyme